MPIKTLIRVMLGRPNKPKGSRLNLGANVEVKTFNPETGDEIIHQSKNLIVTTGIELIRDLLGGTAHRPSHIGLGTGTTAVTAGDTSIETEEYRDEITRRDDLPAGIIFQLFLGLNDGNGFTYTEAGLLETGFQNDQPGDPAILIARDTFTGVAKNNSVELTLTWTINITAS